MTEKKYRLEWVPMEKASRTQVPFAIDKATKKLVYRLPSTLTFGHLEFNGIDITGYFSPEDDETEYTLRPWMFMDIPPEPEAE